METEDDSELLRRLFALMTMKLEDAATEAVDGQGAQRPPSAQIARATRVAVLSSEIHILAEAVMAIGKLEDEGQD
ncbi:hypothetical protein HRJ34_17305 [Rhizorhabdus wittichii]|uniref:Uncharacterized protein n=1 Tax=Rhizorhabdus wittichii TaxID=160791 RepID=A0A975CZB6_9SPHN|nr:hypothetical protein [Rhizorhabdus wittichii]QTH20107.1 hypothetical protein HRJ34_17305 [Rhizorhabdus wittichii]